MRYDASKDLKINYQINHALWFLEESEGRNMTLEVMHKAYELLAKEYCEDMGCLFCNHRVKCLEVCHFEGKDGKEFLKEYFLKKAREE